jgi:hypothetical protein
MAVNNVVTPIPLKSIDSATFTGAYQLLTTASGLPAPVFMLEIINNSNIGVTVSYDGATDHDFVRATSDRQLGMQTNSQPNNQICNFPRGQLVYVKAAAGVGLVYLAGYGQKNVV